ncbi:hypothetical protein Tco_0774549 [Tanacetum coccineum]|uniref:Retrovirus-related Pol polyprotein from transposon TNT 1-94 n=1 Tax=Tanacetum coccineum TaxID=301880 RepID=A0ABQ4ZT36_9ASTR
MHLKFRKEVDPTRYCGMIGSFMYLTSSRPGLIFDVCMCACFADVDHAGFQDKRRSTSGSISKHIDIRYHLIKEQVENGVVELYFVRTKYQLADIFTKALGQERHEFLINKLGMRIISDCNLVFILKASISLKRKIDLLTGIQFLGHDLLYDHAKACIKDSSSYRFKLDNKKFRIGVEVFHEILQICPRLLKHKFVEPPSNEEIVTFIKEIGYKGDLESIINFDFLELKSCRATNVPKKKDSFIADENIISDNPNVALELGKSISKSKTEEQEEARRVHETHKRLITGVVIRETPSVSKKQNPESSMKLKGIEMLFDAPDEPKDKSTDSSEGAGTSTEVPDESNGKIAFDDEDEWGSKDDETFLKNIKEPKVDWLSTDEDDAMNDDDKDEEDDKSIDI